MICNQSKVLLLLGIVVAAVGCARVGPNDPAPSTDAAQKIRDTLVSNSTASSSGQTETQAAKSTGWGTIKGRFVFDGTPPTPGNITVNKDQDVCGKHPLSNEALLVSKDGGLANVVMFARNKNLEAHPDYAATADKPVLLDNSECHFVPHVLTVRTGQPLEIKNSDSVGHNTNIAFATNSPFNAIISSGSPPAVQKLTSAEPAPAAAVCNIHPWMKGYVLVQANPYMVVSAKDGTFEIKNAPAGIPLEFQVWHESSTGANGAVQSDRSDLKWQPNGRFTVTLEPDQVLDLKDIKVPAATLASK